MKRMRQLLLTAAKRLLIYLQLAVRLAPRSLLLLESKAY